jgi:hypothetical protein
MTFMILHLVRPLRADFRRAEAHRLLFDCETRIMPQPSGFV